MKKHLRTQIPGRNGLRLSVFFGRRMRRRATTTSRTARRSCISRSRFLRRYAESTSNSNPAFSARSSCTARVSGGNYGRAESHFTRGSVRASSKGTNDANTRLSRGPSAVFAGLFDRIARSCDTRDSSRAHGSIRRSMRTHARVPEPEPAPRARTTTSARDYLLVRFGRGRGGPSVGSRDRMACPTSTSTCRNLRKRPEESTGGRERARREVLASHLPGK